MANRVRVQLQQSIDNIASEATTDISAKGAIKALRVMQLRGKRHFNHPKWGDAVDLAIRKAVDWVRRTHASGGHIGRASGTAYSTKFIHDKKEYRVDIETHGERDPGWFR